MAAAVPFASVIPRGDGQFCSKEVLFEESGYEAVENNVADVRAICIRIAVGDDAVDVAGAGCAAAIGAANDDLEVQIELVKGLTYDSAELLDFCA